MSNFFMLVKLKIWIYFDSAAASTPQTIILQPFISFLKSFVSFKLVEIRLLSLKKGREKESEKDR